MATSLQKQLAALAANSTHQLDLRAQKTRHSASLLFPPAVAAQQNFDTIFQICIEGFVELTQLDPRFAPFARNLFSEQSRNEDRHMMTQTQNEELNRVVERFLGLVCGRLLLKPAMKAMEWCVRRFRVQEYNVEALLMAFLPYHTSHIFPTLLSILPERLPVNLRWLNPYVASLSSPQRHAVLSAFIANPAFFSAFSQFVLKVARAKNQSVVLLGFWASITAQAVNGMMDSTRSGRENIRQQREEDLLHRVLPILQSALSIQGVPELYLGSCMIMTILATKAQLHDNVLDAMMVAITSSWTEQTMETHEDGMSCLALLAEDKQQMALPQSVTRKILRAENTLQLLEITGQRHRTNKLVLAVCLSALDSDKEDGLDIAASAVERNMLSPRHLDFLVGSLLTKSNTAALERITSRSPDISQVVQSVALRLGFDQTSLVLTFPEVHEDPIVDAPEPMLVDSEPTKNTALPSLPSVDNENHSFLDSANDSAIELYASAFQQSPYNVVNALSPNSDKFSIALVTFCAHIWCSTAFSIATRAQTLEIATTELRKLDKQGDMDVQFLMPYVVVALSDETRQIRQCASEMVVVVDGIYAAAGKKVKAECRTELYGSKTTIAWLGIEDARKVWNTTLARDVEDCVLDSYHLSRVLVEALNASSKSADHKPLKATLRSQICSLLAAHIVATPCLAVKLRLLQILGQVSKAGSEARKDVLLLYVQQWVSQSSIQIQQLCSAQHVDRELLDKALLAVLSHRSSEEISTLKMIARGEMGKRPEVRPLALQALKAMWRAMKGTSRTALADWLFEVVVDEEADESVQSEVLEILQDLHYPTEVLVHLIENLPSTDELQYEGSEPAKKKRRTSRSTDSADVVVDATKLNAAIKRITAVLEVVENSKPAQHPQLLKGLFVLLGELHHFKTLLGSQLVYLQGLIMSCLLSVVDALRTTASATPAIDSSVIRADLIVETLRTTSSTTVHNTALLLISALAAWSPGLVLHSVMPLFTFMSTTLLRQSDEFSAHVTDQTVARIVPPLAESLRRGKGGVVVGASELLGSFTAAYEHVPVMRRAGLFKHLVQTLGAQECLFAVVAMLVERYAISDSGHGGVMKFVLDLMNAFPAVVQLKSLRQYTELCEDGLKSRRTLSDTLLGFGERNIEERTESVDTLLRALADLTKSPLLRKRVAKAPSKGSAEATEVQTLYAGLLKQTMNFPKSEDSTKAAADEVLAALLVLMPTQDFIDSSALLMQNGNDHATHEQVFRALETRAREAASHASSESNVFIDALPNCYIFIRANQPVKTRLAALRCVDAVVETFGKTDRAEVLKAAESVAGSAALGSSDVSLQVYSTLCLASMVEVLGDEMIPLLPGCLGMVLGLLEARQQKEKMMQAGFTFVEAVMGELPWMFDASNLDRVLKICVDSISNSERFCALAARKLGAEQCFAAIHRAWPHAITSAASESACLLLGMAHTAIRRHTKSTIAKTSPVLFVLLLEIFDFRSATPNLEGKDKLELGQLVNAIVLDVVLKLNDTTFRPFFIRFVEWATVEGKQSRQMALYGFVHVLSEELKGIVTSYASFLLEDTAKLLSSLPETMATAAKDEEGEGTQLLRLVLEALTSLFANNTDGTFWLTPAHFEAIMPPLLNLPTQTPTLSATLHALTTSAITALTQSVSTSPDHLTTINKSLLHLLRSPSIATRLHAVRIERAITGSLGLDWLGTTLNVLLPVISELQEDDDEAVEREVLEWVAEVEEVLGEGLGGMLGG